MILIPVKNLDTAKQRLASVLDQPARTALAQVMLQDVLARLAEWTQRPAVAVGGVTRIGAITDRRGVDAGRGVRIARTDKSGDATRTGRCGSPLTARPTHTVPTG